MVKSIGIDGIRKRVIYNQSILSVNRLDTLIFEVYDPILNYRSKFTFSFIDAGRALQAEGGVQADGNVVYTLFGWDGTDVEVSTPVLLTTTNNRQIWLRFRTSSDVNTNRRRFEITIWTEDTQND